jgi:hypothetical protein
MSAIVVGGVGVPIVAAGVGSYSAGRSKAPTPVDAKRAEVVARQIARDTVLANAARHVRLRGTSEGLAARRRTGRLAGAGNGAMAGERVVAARQRAQAIAGTGGGQPTGCAAGTVSAPNGRSLRRGARQGHCLLPTGRSARPMTPNQLS